LDALAGADAVLCEDSRITSRLYALHGLPTRPFLPYHDHNADRVRPEVLERLRAGAALVLVSDAGTPLISDPGFKLVREAVAAGVPVTTLPGPSSLLAALTLAGLPTDRFHFAGFLPEKTNQRRAALADLARLPSTLVLLEATHRLPAALSDMAEILGARPAAVGRELTKLHEEVRRATLPELAEHYAQVGAPKGEAVVVIGPPAEAPPIAQAEIDAMLRRELEAGLRLAEAVERVTAASGGRRREIYARALALRDQGA